FEPSGAVTTGRSRSSKRLITAVMFSPWERNCPLTPGRRSTPHGDIGHSRLTRTTSPSLGDRANTAISRAELGVVLRESGELAEAENALRGALETLLDVGRRDEVQTALCNLGVLAFARERFSEA